MSGADLARQAVLQKQIEEAKKVYLAVFDECIGLSLRKSQDYGDPDPAKTSYMPFGDESYAQMLHTKTQRIVSLIKQDRAANFESVDDTLKDLINYAFFYAAWRGIGRKRD